MPNIRLNMLFWGWFLYAGGLIYNIASIFINTKIIDGNIYVVLGLICIYFAQKEKEEKEKTNQLIEVVQEMSRTITHNTLAITVMDSHMQGPKIQPQTLETVGGTTPRRIRSTIPERGVEPGDR
jgi:hypothetical protein